MAKLIFLLDGNVIQEYPLDKERMTIGRRAANDIHIDNLAISGEHAAIIIEGEGAYIEDLNSTNGTLVNQKRITKQTLNHGDEIGLGKYSLKYLTEGLQHAPKDGFVDTVTVETATSAPESESDDVVALPIADEGATSVEAASIEETSAEETGNDDDDTASETEAAEEATAETEVAPQEDEPSSPEEAAVSTPRLQILNGNNAGNALLLDKSMVKIGEPGTQVAVVTKRQEGYFLTHVAGESYPLINGKTIGAQAYALNNYDVIEVLDSKMEFRLD